MNEHDLLEAIGQISDALIEKTALPDTQYFGAGTRSQEEIVLSHTVTKKKPVPIRAGAAAAVVALCIALNAAVFMGISKLRQNPDDTGMTPGAMISDMQEEEPPYMEVTEVLPQEVHVTLHNPTSNDIVYKDGFDLCQNYVRVATDGLECSTLTLAANSQTETVFYYDFAAHPTAEYELVNLAVEGTSESVFASVTFTYNAQRVHIPNCVTEDYQTAHAVLIDAGMIVDMRTANDEDIPFGQIIGMQIDGDCEQDADGYWVTQGSFVKITVSIGASAQPADTPVPNFTGMTWGLAEETAKGLGFLVLREDIYDSAPVGTVISQDAGAGMTSATGIIFLYVSLGEPGGDEASPVYIPAEYIGADYETVKEELLNAGLLIDKRSVYNPDVPEGCVVSIRSTDGTFDVVEDFAIRVGSYVMVTVSLGEPPITVPLPRFVGMKQEYAIETAEGMGLVLNITEADSSEPAGTVIAQNVEPGTEVSPESIVIELTVSNGNG